MLIPINKDFERDFKEDFFKGFSFHEFIAVLVSAASVILAAVFFSQICGISLDMAALLGVPCAIPATFIGFWRSPTGLSVIAYMQAKSRWKQTQHLIYQNMEYSVAVSEVEKKIIELTKEKELWEKEQQKQMKLKRKEYRKNFKKSR